MKNRANRLFALWVLAPALLVTCDPFKEDIIPPNEEIKVDLAATQYFILPGSSAIINAKSIVLSSLSSYTMMVNQDPARGYLTSLGDFLYKYEPASYFTEGSDHFTIDFMKGSVLAKTVTITIHTKQSVTEFPCTLHAIENSVFTYSDFAKAIKILNNDRMCGINIETIKVSIHTHPEHGTIEMVNDSIIKYTPEKDFLGRFESVYKIEASRNDSTIISYGLVTIIVGNWNLLGRTGDHLYSVHFLDTQVGFVGGVGRMLKTTDGGTTWTPLSIPPNLSIDDMYFTDLQHGFAVGRVMLGSLQDPGVFLKTSDGGLSWEATYFESGSGVSSVFFTSPLTGYICKSFLTEDGSSILKTSDGGDSWVTYPANGEIWDLKFTNASTGFARSAEGILTTVDAGENWFPLATFDWISSLTINDGLFFAMINSFEDINEKIRIWRSSNGVDWNLVCDDLGVQPTSAVHLAFSPSNSTGIVFGCNDIGTGSPHFVPLAYRTVDFGQTWVKEELPWLTDSHDIIKVFFVNENMAYAVGGNGLIMKYSR